MPVNPFSTILSTLCQSAKISEYIPQLETSQKTRTRMTQDKSTTLQSALDNHIDVSVETHFIWQESDPFDLRYTFAYTVTIINKGWSRSKLLNRHWLITNAEGNQETVDGTGVVGMTPTLSPGESFEYTSGTVLETSFGTMEGHYEFEDDQGFRFKVPIPPFILSIPRTVEN